MGKGQRGCGLWVGGRVVQWDLEWFKGGLKETRKRKQHLKLFIRWLVCWYTLVREHLRVCVAAFVT
jgi:hypothetical protein